MKKPYKIKRERAISIPRPPTGRRPAKVGEILTGYIGYDKASDLEERSARSLDRNKIKFSFRMQFIPADPPIVIANKLGRNQLGAIEADFIFERAAQTVAVQVDGEFAHKTAEQIESDRLKDAQLTNILYQLGGGFVIRVPHFWLETQEQSDNTWNQLISGRNDFGSES
jgi:hypothetical protein